MNDLGHSDLAGRVTEKAVVPGDDNLGGPTCGPGAKNTKLERQEVGVCLGQLDVRVDPRDKGGNDLRASGVIVRQFVAQTPSKAQ